MCELSRTEEEAGGHSNISILLLPAELEFVSVTAAQPARRSRLPEDQEETRSNTRPPKKVSFKKRRKHPSSSSL